MKYNFYTILDTGFLSRTLVLYHSVAQHCPGPFRYWALCLDDASYNIMKEMQLPSVFLLTLKDIEDDSLLEAKKGRTLREYSWTLKPSVATYILNKYSDTETLLYLDGDLYFYSSLAPIYAEFKDKSVLLFPHHFPDGKRANEEAVGKYNAGMIMFKNDARARKCLEWWRRECNAWCYFKYDSPGKLGDQKYLDYFEEQFEGVHVITHLGVDVAPWNIKNFRSKITRTGDAVFLDGHKLINFHFSNLQLYYPYSFFLPSGPTNVYGYTKPSPEKSFIYNEYIRKIYGEIKNIQKYSRGFKDGTFPRPSLLKQLLELAEIWKEVIRRKIRT